MANVVICLAFARSVCCGQDIHYSDRKDKQGESQEAAEESCLGELAVGTDGAAITLIGISYKKLAHRDEIMVIIQHANQTFAEDELPKRYVGISHCFRTEAGAAGRDTRGIYRVHQFTKVEMFAFCTPEQSDAIHEEIREIEQDIFIGLGIPFHVIDTCTGDLGGPAYRKYDLEAWMPGRGPAGDYGEITSTSNCTDYQTRRLGIRYRPKDKKGGGLPFVHTLNGTAVACTRAIIAILENYQQADGTVLVPEALRPWVGKERITVKK